MLHKSLVFLVLVVFSSCSNSLTNKEKEDLIVKGKENTESTFKELSSNLMEQMKLGGPKQAIPFCNVQAMPITDKYSENFNVSIKRTTDKLRNTKNEATKRELEIIKKFQSNLQNKIVIKPIVELGNQNKKHFYAPIIVNSKCLSCHGELKKEVSIKTDSLIKTLYKNDLAIGYKVGDLRGIWSVTFNE